MQITCRLIRSVCDPTCFLYKAFSLKMTLRIDCFLTRQKSFYIYTHCESWLGHWLAYFHRDALTRCCFFHSKDHTCSFHSNSIKGNWIGKSCQVELRILSKPKLCCILSICLFSRWFPEKGTFLSVINSNRDKFVSWIDMQISFRRPVCDRTSVNYKTVSLKYLILVRQRTDS